MTHAPYIVIEGVIGVGKTTLARLLQPVFEAELVLEVFEENPFLSNFYADRARYAFQTQIFFLLSRYRQQSGLTPPTRRKHPIVSDYTFTKDRLFAMLNLSGDELAVYERVHDALGKHITPPDLLVYLKADHEVLMARIAARDRPYERNMDPDYIEGLRRAYDDFIANYDQGKVISIDTNDLNIIQDEDDLDSVVERVKSALGYGVHQTQLPGVNGIGSTSDREPESILIELESKVSSLPEFQQFHLSLDAEKGFDPELLFNFTLLTEEIGELASVITLIKSTEMRYLAAGLSRDEALGKAVADHHPRMQDELADCLAYLLKLSNYTGIDLEAAYLQKMNINTKRTWEDGHVFK
jgi:deoxyadenosine/deoxycytidine kinase/NTP pyrophosphatase (non-canonical NTP hydrolase)